MANNESQLKQGVKSKILIAAVIIVVLVLSVAVYNAVQKYRVKKVAEKVKYTVVEDKTNPSGVRLKLLVDPRTTKDEAMSLGKSLRDKYYDSNSFIWISIYDDLGTAKISDSNSMSDRDMKQHFLVLVTVDKKAEFDEVKWVRGSRLLKDEE